MRKAGVLLAIIAMIFNVCICSQGDTEVTVSTETMAEGFKINNDPIGNPKTRYSIADLRAFFDNQSGI